MAQYTIHHTPKLSGEVLISASKNAVLPILAAALLTDEEVLIRMAPDLSDVNNMCRILQLCGAEVARSGTVIHT